MRWAAESEDARVSGIETEIICRSAFADAPASAQALKSARFERTRLFSLDT